MKQKTAIKKCKKCRKLYLKFDHIPKKQPCPHCQEADEGVEVK